MTHSRSFLDKVLKPGNFKDLEAYEVRVTGDQRFGDQLGRSCSLIL
jgi:hypothetical protein